LLISLFISLSVLEIMKIHINPSPTSRFLWTLSSDGNIFTKSAHKLINKNRTSTAISPLATYTWKSLWKLNLNARLVLFLWKIAWDILPTKAKLKAIFPIPHLESYCPLYNSEEDSLSHLFFRCIFARVAWRNSFWPLNSLAWSSLSLPDWINGIINPFSSLGIPLADFHLFQIFAAVLCDLLWFSRNKAYHESVIPDINSLANSIRKTTMQHAAAWHSHSPVVKEHWSPPPTGSFKVNFDTAIHEQFSMQAAVCRDSQGLILKALSQISPQCEANFGEALAAQLAASLAVSMDLQTFSLEGDSATVIAALKTPALSQDWQINSVIAATLASLPASFSWETRKVHRSANFCAHQVAFWVAARGFSSCIPIFFPTYLPPPSSIPLYSGKDPPSPLVSCL
jgi:hypothetical protein